MSQSIFIDDIGVKIILSVETDISEATAVKIKYEKPDGTVGEWTAIKESSTSISYTTAAGDINIMGTWNLQAYVVTPAWSLHGKIARLTVKPTL